VGLAIETIAGRALNPGAALPGAQLTNNTGSSFTVRSAQETSAVRLQGMWAKGLAGGVFNIHSPRMHDNTTGISIPYTPNLPIDALAESPPQLLVPNDPLFATITGGAAETDCGYATISYDALDGIAAVLRTEAEVTPNIKNLVTVRVTVSAAVTVGDWSPGTPLNATDDKLHADALYAVLGMIPTNTVGAVAIQGADTGNLKVGMPGLNASQDIDSRYYFLLQSRTEDTPFIPIIKANNKSSTLVFQCDNAAGANNDVFVILAELTG
jgi:hypothetical protein